jgi:hypothetical protein
MQVLAGSLDVETSDFLHAGYLSAYPRTFTQQGQHRLGRYEGKLVDVKKSLELKETDAGAPVSQVSVSTSNSSEGISLLLRPASMVTDGFMMLVVFLFFGYLIRSYYLRIAGMKRPGLRPWLLAAAPILLFVFVVHFAAPRVHETCLDHSTPPWLDVAVQEYEDPEAATEAILHGLIAYSLPGAPSHVQTLAGIQGQVAFPVERDQYTPGMAYAERTYGLDGWGREFRLERIGRLRKRQYRIASAGPDGEHGTMDDIALVIEHESDNWEALVNGMYVRRIDGEYRCFIHCVDHEHFRYEAAGAAREATGSDLFDVLAFDRVLRVWDHTKEPPPIRTLILNHEVFGQSDERNDPLVFVRFLKPREQDEPLAHVSPRG